MFLILVATLNTEHLLCALYMVSHLIIPRARGCRCYYLSFLFYIGGEKSLKKLNRAMASQLVRTQCCFLLLSTLRHHPSLAKIGGWRRMLCSYVFRLLDFFFSERFPLVLQVERLDVQFLCCKAAWPLNPLSQEVVTCPTSPSRQRSKLGWKLTGRVLGASALGECPWHPRLCLDSITWGSSAVFQSPA